MPLALVKPKQIVTDIEFFDPKRHLEEYLSWGLPVSADLLGAGLIIPGKAAGFIDGIGYTKAVYIYGLRANPQIAVVARMRASMRLVEAGIKAARDSGYSYGVLSTSNASVWKVFAKRLGFVGTSDGMMEGTL